MDEGGEGACLFEAEAVAEVIKCLCERTTGADFKIGHVDVGGERRIGIAEFAPDPVECGLHGEASVRAHDQEIHEIRKAGLMLAAL